MRSTSKASQVMKAISYEYAFVGRSNVQFTDYLPTCMHVHIKPFLVGQH